MRRQTRRPERAPLRGDGERSDDARHDASAWLRDPGYPEVTDPRILGYLAAENAYFEHEMAPHAPLVERLFQEIKGRQPQADASVPYREGNYWYQWRYEHEAQYRIWLRAPGRAAPFIWEIW